MRREAMAAGLLCCAVVAACARAPAAAGSATVEVRASDGEPLAEVPLLVGDRVLARTDASGRARVELPSGSPRVAIHVQCPPDFRALTEPLWVRSGDMRALAAEAPVASVSATCAPLLGSVALVVSSHGVAHCPVVVNGAVMGETDERGFAHVLVRAAPESLAELELRAPGAEPWRVSRAFRVPEGEAFLAVEEAVPRPRPHRRGRRAAGVGGPRIYRIL